MTIDLARKENLWHSDVFQDALGNSNSLQFIGIGVRVVDLCMLAIPQIVKMARVDDDAAEGEHVAAALVGRIDPEGLGAEIDNRCPVLQRGCGLRVDMLEMDAEVILSGEVPAVERHICVPVAGML